MNVIQLLTNPDEFFNELSEKKVSFKMPILIITVMTIISSIYSYYSINVISQIYPSEMASMKIIMLIGAMAGAVIGPYISWLMISIIIYLITIVFKGEGSLKRTVEFIGYGFLPNIIGTIIITIVGIYFLSNIHVEPLTMSQMTNPEIMKSTMNNIIPKTFIIISLLVNMGISIWNLIIWTFGIKYARNLPLNKAAISVAIPTILFMLITIASLIPKLFS